MGIDLEKLEPTTSRAKCIAGSLENFDQFQDYLIQKRKSEGLTQQELAGKLGITQPAVSNFENSRTEMSVQTLISYAATLGIEISFLPQVQPRD